MAEVFAVISIVASIVQLVDFSSKVLRRLEELQTNLGEITVSLKHVQTELPVLQVTLQQTRAAIDAGSVCDATKTALLPVIKGCTEQIGLLEPILVKMVSTPTDSWRKRGTKAISSVRQEPKIENIMKTIRCYISTLTFYFAASSSTLQPLTDAKLTEIRQWLSPPDPSLNYQKALKRRQAGTGLWLLESDAYFAWRTDPASFLWLHGIPGCGKTILSSTVLHNVLEYCTDDVGKVVAYFYFDFNDIQKQSPEAMVRSLISQISQQCLSIPTCLETLHSSCENGTRQPSVDSLLEVLHSMLQEFPQSYILLDALDECTHRTELMTILETVAEWKLDELHVLLTSRREHEILCSLESIVTTQNAICLQSEVVDPDISIYIRQRLSDDKALSKWQKDSQTRNQIETTLMNGAHGMFRWAVCQMDTLGKCRNRSALRKSLETLPPTLDETYDRILCNIDKDDSIYADRVLRWLAFAVRPLLLEEIAEVIAIDVERNPAFDREEVLEDPLEVLSICSSLVTITTTENDWSTVQVVALAHYSVKEYLTSERILQSKAAKYSIQNTTCNDFIARGCIGYLLQFQTLDSLSAEKVQESKLASYAAKFWITHTKAAAPETEALTRLIMELFSTTNDAYRNWISISDPDNPNGVPANSDKVADIPAPLYYASLSNLVNIVALLVSVHGADVNAEGGHFGTALLAASNFGYDKTIELLLAHGANVNAGRKFFEPALQAASGHGYDKTVKLLLAHGANVNERGNYRTALQEATYGGHEKTIEVLLAYGADIQAREGSDRTTLHVASFHGYEKIVELLLAHGADVNTQAITGTALHEASSGGHEKTVKLLLAHGADVNARRPDNVTALHEASQTGHEKIVEVLLAHGADIDARGGLKGTALDEASSGGFEKVVELLLASGATTEAQGGSVNVI